MIRNESPVNIPISLLQYNTLNHIIHPYTSPKNVKLKENIYGQSCIFFFVFYYFFLNSEPVVFLGRVAGHSRLTIWRGTVGWQFGGVQVIEMIPCSSPVPPKMKIILETSSVRTFDDFNANCDIYAKCSNLYTVLSEYFNLNSVYMPSKWQVKQSIQLASSNYLVSKWVRSVVSKWVLSVILRVRYPRVSATHPRGLANV